MKLCFSLFFYTLIKALQEPPCQLDFPLFTSLLYFTLKWSMLLYTLSTARHNIVPFVCCAKWNTL